MTPSAPTRRWASRRATLFAAILVSVAFWALVPMSAEATTGHPGAAPQANRATTATVQHAKKAKKHKKHPKTTKVKKKRHQQHKPKPTKPTPTPTKPTPPTPTKPTDPTPPAPTPTEPTEPTDPTPPTPPPAPVESANRVFMWMNAQRSSLNATSQNTAQTRMQAVVADIRAAGAAFGVLAETEADQRAYFRDAAGAQFGLIDGGNSLDNVVFYDTAAFSLAATEALTTYYFDGQTINTAIPVLKDKTTGHLVAVVPVHNPADAYGYKDASWRTKDRAAQIAFATSFAQANPGADVVVAGDFNERVKPACEFTAAGLVSLVTTAATCQDTTGVPIDQMFATAGLDPTDYAATPTTATDHGYRYQATLHLAA